MPKTKIREITIVEEKGMFSIFKSSDKKNKYDFEGISLLKKILSNEKARLIHTIKTEKPTSIYNLSKKLDRTFKSVSDDVKLLERFGFIELVPETTKKRKRLRPVLAVENMVISLKI